MSKSKSSTTRTDRAAQLLTSGKVQLFVGRGYAVVAGKTGEYVVSKQGCTCKDAETRNRTGCYHALAVRQLCEEYKALKAQAERGETVRPSIALLQAIRWPTRATIAPAVETSAPATVPCQFCGEPALADVGECRDCFLESFGRRHDLLDDQSDLFNPYTLSTVAA